MSSRSHHITAYHEAGHAVAAIVLDVGFEKVTIVGDEEAYGRIIYDDAEEWKLSGRANPAVIKSAEASVVVSFAGAVAQRRFAPRSRWRHGQTSDLSKVRRMIDYMDRSDDAAYYKELEARAETLVEENWPLIVKLADTLVWQKTMYADDVYELLFGTIDEMEVDFRVTDCRHCLGLATATTMSVSRNPPPPKAK